MGKNNCNRCGSNNLIDSRARGMEPVVSALLPLDSFRCKDCLLRGMYRVNFFTNYWRVGFWLLIVLIILLFLFDEFSSSSAERNAVSDLRKETAEFTSKQSQPIGERARLAEVSLAQSQELVATKPTIVGSKVVPVTTSETEGKDDRNLSIVESSSFDNVGGASAELGSAASDSRIPKFQQSTMIGQAVTTEVDEADNTELSENFAKTQTDADQRPEESVRRALDGWKSAWEVGDVALYLAAYSDEFAPNAGVSYENWRIRRTNIVGRQENRRISLDNIKTVFSQEGDRVLVDFNQAFESDSYKDVVRKRIYLKKRFNRWLIVREDVI